MPPVRIAPGPGTEQRATLRLKRYWMTLRRNANGPYFADFRPERNPIPWTCCCLAFFSRGRFSLEHFGEGYRAEFGIGEADIGSGAAGSRFAGLFGSVADALAGSRPVEAEGADDQGDRTVLYRSILLPFVDLEGSPAYVLGAFTSSAERAFRRTMSAEFTSPFPPTAK